MIVTELLDALPVWAVFLASLSIIFFSLEAGFILGRIRRKKLSYEEKSQTGIVVTATLTLLTFMLAFVYSAVESRYIVSKAVALNEANAVGTAFRRADLLPDPTRSEFRHLLFDYVTMRIEVIQTESKRQIEKAIDRSGEIQDDLWSMAVDLAELEATPISALLVVSVNELSDQHEKRITVGFHYRLAGITWVVLYGLAILSMTVTGFDSGFRGRRRVVITNMLVALAFSVVLTLVIALDRPQQHVSAQTMSAMIDLQADMRKSIQNKPQ